jgi:hypothetical protein
LRARGRRVPAHAADEGENDIVKYSIRSLAASLAVTACLWPVAASAQDQGVPSNSSGMTVEQVRDSFTSAGFQVDAPLSWDWTTPPVSSIQVHDPAHNRVLMVLVYPNAAAADLGRQQAEANDPSPDAAGFGPHLVVGYGQSTWHAHVAMVQTTQSDLERQYQIQNDRANNAYIEPYQVQAPDLPNYAVDFDFQQALDNGAVNF